jgi:hypothetical protein
VYEDVDGCDALPSYSPPPPQRPKIFLTVVRLDNLSGMATAQYAIAYLDLTGNRVNWTSADKDHSSIILDGTNFGGTINMAMLVISALCLLCFFVLLFGSCWAYCGDRNAKQYLPWSGVWVPMFCKYTNG